MSEAKAREAAVRRSEAGLPIIIDSTLDPHVLLEAVRDEAGTIVDFTYGDANRAACEYNGLLYEELVGARLLDLLPGHAGNGLLEQYRQVVETGEPLVLDGITYEQELLGGEARRYDMRAVRVGDGLSYTWRDVTDRHVAAAALAASEEEFRTLAEVVPQIVWMTGADGQNTYFNQQWVDYTGMTLEESRGDGWNTPFHPDDRQRAWNAWQRATQEDAPYSLECRLRRADGAYRWWLVRGAPLRDADGEIVKWFGTCTDIEELKQADEEVRRLNAELEERVLARTAQLAAVNDALVKEIDERKCREVELRESEERFRALFDSSLDAVFLTRPDGAIEAVNPAACTMFGYSKDALRALSRDDVLDRGDPNLDARLSERSHDGSVRGAELSGVRKSGGRFPAEVDSVILPGEPARSFMIVRDISERKRAEEALRESEERFRAVQDNSLDRFTILKPSSGEQGEITDFTLVYQNARAAETTGRSPQELVGLRMTEVYPTFAQTRFFEIYKRVVETGKATEFEEHYDADGVEDYFRATVTPIPGGIAVATQIITERRAAEEALRESETRYRTIVETAGEGIVVARPNGAFQFVNQRMAEMLGYPPEELLGKSSTDLTFDDWVPTVLDVSADLPARKVTTGEFRFRRRDGSELWSSWNATPMFDGDGRHVANLAMHVDITERKRLEAELEANRERYDRLAQVAADEQVGRDRRQEPRLGSGHPTLVWLPLPLMVVAAAALYLAGPHLVAESTVLLATLNTLFVGVTGLLLAFLAANTYVATGGRGLLALACAALTMGIVYILAAPLLGVSVDALLVIHNVGALGASVLFILSAVWIIHEGSPQVPRSRRQAYAVLSLFAVLIALAVLALAALSKATPAFFLPESGTVTPLREAVLGAAVGGFVVAALLAYLAWRKTRSAFLKWYSLGLAMLAVGLGTVWLGEPGSLISWLGRGIQYAGGVYLLVAIIIAILDSGRWRIVFSRSLREVEERYSNVVAMSPDAIIVQADGNCVFANPAAVLLFGVSSTEELVGSRLVDFFHSEQRETLARRIHDALSGALLPAEESVVIRPDDTFVPVDVSGAGVEYEGRPAVQLIMRDITIRKEAEALLRQHEAERVAQEERSRIARNLHDSVTQALFAASLKAEALTLAGDQTPARAAASEDVRRLSRGALAEMRTMLLELRGDPVAEVPLQQLLRHLVEAAESRAKVNVSLSVDEHVALPPNVHEAAYRITQEALNNVVRHAKAENAWVQVRADDGHVRLVVGDDGKGFDPASVGQGHFGLASLRERGKETGGEVSVTSADGEGTVVIADWKSL